MSKPYTRRTFVKATLACAAYAALPAPARAFAQAGSRSVQLYNSHTGETLRTMYWEQGNYLPESLRQISSLMRDHRNNTMHTIDPRLMDLLANIHFWLGADRPYEVISGYRSPQTNALLHATTSGVAVHSMHMFGKAIDIRLPGKRLADVHNVALGLRGGGVGFYPGSNFVHVDTGPLRQWQAGGKREKNHYEDF